MGITDSIQAFSRKPNEDKRNPEPELNKRLIVWGGGEPMKTKGVLDVGCGYGIEMRALHDAGVPVKGIEPSVVMLKNAEPAMRSMIIAGSATKIPFADDAFGGILCKDVLVFLSEKQRLAFFREARRVLVSGGEVLLVTELREFTSATFGMGRVRPYTEYLHEEPAYGDIEKWRAHLEQVSEKLKGKKGCRNPLVFWRTHVDEVWALASRAGLVMVSAERLDREKNDPIAVQNRWTTEPLAIIRLQKTSVI